MRASSRLKPASDVVFAAIVLKPEDHIKSADRRQADIGECAGGQWGGGGEVRRISEM
ncbi:MAG: hypothetical protein C5S48_09050 [Candidatus Methanogaster sp.]|nr:MAG: hypothetical protein C5S48_09050 [ANME-2 cluster archaeon]